MKRLAVFVAAILLGAATGELLCHWPAFRDLAGRVTGRGGLVNIVNGKGIYESDLGGDEEISVTEVVLAENLRSAAAAERPHPARVEGEIELLKAQFGNDAAFAAALRGTGLDSWWLHEMVTANLRGLEWFDRQVTLAPAIPAEECRKRGGDRRTGNPPATGRSAFAARG